MSNQKKKKIILVTPTGVAIYPHLQEPNTRFDADGRYEVRMRWPTEVIQPIVDKVDKMIAEFHTETFKDDKKKAKTIPKDSPFKAVLDDDGEETGETECKFSLRATIGWKDKTTGERKGRKQRPTVVDAKRKETKVSPYSGSEMKVAFEPKPGYWTGQSKVSASLNLEGVQIIKLVEGSGRSIDDLGFDDEDGFYDDEFDGSSDTVTDDTSSDVEDDADF